MSGPAAGERVEASRRFLLGLAGGDDAIQLVDEIVDLLVRNNTFPGGVSMEPAAERSKATELWQLDIASPDLGGTATFVVDDAGDWRARWKTISLDRRPR